MTGYNHGLLKYKELYDDNNNLVVVVVLHAGAAKPC